MEDRHWHVLQVVMPEKILTDRSISAGQFRLYVALARLWARSRTADVDHPTLAQMMGISKRQITDNIAALLARGYITREPTGRRPGPKYRYLPAVVTCDDQS